VDVTSVLWLLALGAVLLGVGAARYWYVFLGYSDDRGSPRAFRIAVALTAAGVCLLAVALGARAFILVYAANGSG
jgi:hypothetical protein